MLAVGWVGDPADLKKDCAGLGEFRDFWHMCDMRTISQNSASRVKVALLLRCSAVDLAEAVWKAGGNPFQGVDGKDPYAAMAQDWIDGWYTVAVTAHADGKDAFAGQMFRALVPIKTAVHAATVRHGLPANDSSYLGETDQTPEFIADQERRAAEPPHPAALAMGKSVPQKERIEALIRDLELVKGVQWMVPGKSELVEDPVVKALIHEGDAAVEPLIDCLAEDPPRLTRAQYSAAESGLVLHVYEAAYESLGAILGTSPKTPEVRMHADRIFERSHELSLPIRQALAAKVRAYWAKYKSMPLAERMYGALRDDTAEPREWFNAAGRILMSSGSLTFENLFENSPSSEGFSSPNSGTIGDPLRAKKDPSVTDLLIKRWNQMLPLSRSGKLITVDLPSDAAAAGITYAQMSSMLKNIADWDGKARMAEITDMTRRLNARFSEANGTGEDPAAMVGTNMQMFEKRATDGDPAVFAEYGQWLDTHSSRSPSKGGYQIQDYDCNVLPILWEHPDDPAVRKIAGRIFGENSPWLPQSPAEHQEFARLVHRPLFVLEAFRRFVLGRLADRSAMGYTRKGDDAQVTVQVDGAPHIDGHPELPKMPFRVCDYYASELSGLREFPEFDLTWPAPRRAAAISKIETFLKTYGNNYQPNTANGWSAVAIALPPLDHPARPEDVAQGRAVFSLEGAETRIFKMSKFPVAANRPDSSKGPYVALFIRDFYGDMKTQREIRQDTDTGGNIWQAEEVRTGGKWERYFGFAGRHQLEKVRADEIEFSRVGDLEIAPKIDCAVSPMPNTCPTGKLEDSQLQTLAAPLVLKLDAHNHHGLDHEVPAAYILPADAGQALPAAIQLALSYSEKNPSWIVGHVPRAPFSWPYPGGGEPVDYGMWNDIPLRDEVKREPSVSSASSLGPDSRLNLLNIDLRDYFAITRPGTYRLKITFQEPGKKTLATREIFYHVTEGTTQTATVAIPGA
jgi:hypothetical protein